MDAGSRDDNQQFTRVGGGKQQKGKKQKKVEYEDVFNFDVGTIQKFGMIQVSPPISIEDLDKKINEINVRHEWYKSNGQTKLAEQIKEL